MDARPIRDMPSNWEAAQRFVEELRALGPTFTGESHALSTDEAWNGVGRLHVQCDALGVAGILQSFGRNADECVVALDVGSVKVPRSTLRVPETA